MSARRAFLLAAAAWPALAWTRGVFAQSKLPGLIGWLQADSRTASGRALMAFKEGMAALGWKEGSNYILEDRWADGRIDRLPTLAAELAAKRPLVIVTSPLPATIAAAKAAPDIPVVQSNGGTPLFGGLAKSLARPGGMVTGLTNINAEISEKFLELLVTSAPKMKRVGYLIDSNQAARARRVERERRSAAQFSVEARFAEAAKPGDLDPAIERLAKEGVQGLVLTPSGWFTLERKRIMTLELAQDWPVIAGPQSFVEEGALLSYGADRVALHRRAAYYVDRILKGTKPGDLPIEQPTKFELTVNMKTAKALGLTIPPSIMVQATRVIE